MTSERLKIFNLSQLPASPPRFGAQARLHGLMSELGRRHDLTAMVLLDDEFDADECRKAMLEYCKEVILVPNTLGRGGTGKRLLQLGSLASFKSFERLRLTVPALQHAVDAVLRKQRFDIVNLEFSFLGYCNLRQAPQGEKAPPVIVDSHNIDYDLARQYAKTGGSALRRFYAGVNWRKLRREELRTYREADGVTLCSVADQQRLLSEAPGVKTVVIPNAANVDYFQPRQSNAPAGEQTIVFFGLMSYQPNIDAIQYFVANIWPRIAAANPGVRFKIIGGKPPKSLLALAGPAIEFTGLVDDLRPHLANAAAIVVPLRLGGGTRLKIVEGMAMGKAIVSTSLGAEGIDAVSGRDILIADEPDAFADAVNRLLADPALAARMGRSARELSVERYSWKGAATALDGFYRRILESRS